MGLRRYRRTLQATTLLGTVGGVVVAYYGITLSSLVQAAAPGGARLAVAAIALATIGCLYACASMLGFCGSTAKHERVRCLMIYFYATIVVSVLLVLFTYMALAAPSAIANWLRLHWSVLGLEGHACCQTYDSAITYLSHRFTTLGGLAVASIACMFASLYCVIKIVTVPTVMRDILSVINVIFVFLGLATFGYGLYMMAHDALDAGEDWIASIFTAIGVAVFVLATLGLVGAKAKSRSLLLAYAVGVVLCLVVLLASAIFAFVAASHLATSYELTHDAGDIACTARLFGCSNCTGDVQCLGAQRRSPTLDVWQPCNASSPEPCLHLATVLFPMPSMASVPSPLYNQVAPCGHCPEWPAVEVASYMQRSLDLVGILCLVNWLFLAIALVAALILRRSLQGYQTESI
ncbi:hypothetical protein SPRG_07808 [Saprolegnia parasitica CBS 223.65]|uniref:Tetraspanin n=1 Tax=Saprolegnia parasitica (strain CBS 223.65) TaxID=695850 RepID=A0A067CJX0_SAPPC|nr:hypothetical protein SPRG_07808 [Saprolegnia parasitica CBS 223.65]KDO27097.1 hypothetical protein SPRG_07808 [Saprolegnia parasitica CBS 223.65]|eukprot:XP_012202191.1 hypothetical protein SPRG_07808 [Saprolegnia parasitica CBS 223.65]